MNCNVVPLRNGRFFWHLDGDASDHIGTGAYAELQEAIELFKLDEGGELEDQDD